MTAGLRRSALGVMLLAAAAGAAQAQDTRADVIAQAQAEKAARLAPYVPSKAERIASDVQARLLGAPSGLYPWFDSVYSGGGFTLGAGYRRFMGDRTFWDARGLYSLKSYKRLELVATSLGHAHDHVDLQTIGGWRDATQVSFYGIGPGTTVDDKSNFGMEQGYIGATARIRSGLMSFVQLGLQFDQYQVKSGSGSSRSTEEAYSPETAPGLDSQPGFLHTTIGGGVDTRPSEGYARHGGLYALTYDNWADHDQTYDFDRLTAEGVQHIPILRENWVVSLHGVVQTTLGDTDVVPFYLLPSLGSGSTLRAYPSWRFRDRHSLLMSGEWRWIPSRLGLDMAIFYDAGKVASRREDLDFTDLKTDVGVGVRLHGPAATPLRIDVAHGSEGLNIVISGAAAF
jgi:hypothetical protein